VGFFVAPDSRSPARSRKNAGIPLWKNDPVTFLPIS
jgi:hypothetical protein